MADPLAGRTVLVIEDDPLLLEAMARAFLKSNAKVLVATNGAEGLERFNGASPDLVVTDIIMPEREGIETLMSIKAARPAVQVLAVSGGGHTPAGKFLELASAVGADAVLAKPFRAQELTDAARALFMKADADGGV